MAPSTRTGERGGQWGGERRELRRGHDAAAHAPLPPLPVLKPTQPIVVSPAPAASSLPQPSPSPGDSPVTIRPLTPADSFAELTALLHRAYAKQVQLGLRPLAGRQDEATTRRRCQSGSTFVATLPDSPALVGTILVGEIEDAAFPPTFLREGVEHFSLFAVDPRHQGHGIGCRLLATAEHHARTHGARWLALSMAEPDESLRAFYAHRRYEFVEHWQWPYTNYRSVILAKALA